MKLRVWFVERGFRLACVGFTLSFVASGGAQTEYDFNLSVNSSVYCLAVQPDGRILVANPFFPQRLEPDGTPDASFDLLSGGAGSYGAPPTVYCWAVQADGKILAGGDFRALGGVACTNLCRLNSDGSLDTSFVCGADDAVFCLAVQPDGKILVGGGFRALGGQSRAGLGRVNPDGSLDSSFDPGSDGVPFSLAIQSDGNILVGGSFSVLGHQSCTNLGRLNVEGALDGSFLPPGVGFVNCLAGQADGKVLVGAALASSTPGSTNSLLRFNPDGSLDSAFNPQVNGAVYSLAVQCDGKVLVGGQFVKLGGQARIGAGRLNPDGTLDPGFDPLAYSAVSALAVQEDGKMLLGGLLEAADGTTNGYLGRILNSEAATEAFGLSGSTLTWLRGGSSPELWSAQFEHSTNGTDWFPLGVPTRTSGGWALPGVSLQNGELIRARGYVSVGQYNGASWFITSQATNGDALAPVLITQPFDSTNYVGGTARLSVVAGLEPLRYQWLKDGTNVPAATNATLQLSPVQVSDAGEYSVVVSNGAGTRTSSTATLVVRPRPSIASIGIQSGRVAFWISAQNCQRVIVESSVDLRTWTAVQTNPVGAGSSVGLELTVPVSSNPGRQFYRVQQQ